MDDSNSKVESVLTTELINKPSVCETGAFAALRDGCAIFNSGILLLCSRKCKVWLLLIICALEDNSAYLANMAPAGLQRAS